MRRIHQKINTPLVVYKFGFDAKLLFVFYVEATGKISLAEQVKLSLVYNRTRTSVDSLQKKLHGNCELDYFKRRFDRCQDEWAKQHLSEIECRDVAGSNVEMRQLRAISRSKEQRLHDHFEKMATSSGDLCKEMIENSLNRSMQTSTKISTTGGSSESRCQVNVEETEAMLKNVLYPVFLGPIAKKLKDNTELLVNVVVDTAYMKLLVLTLNDYNMRDDMKASKIVYNLVLDSFLLSAVSVLTGRWMIFL